MNVFETIDQLFAQVSQQLQAKSNASQEIACALQMLKTQVICTIAIGNQQPIHHIVQSLQGFQIPLQHGEINFEPTSS